MGRKRGKSKVGKGEGGNEQGNFQGVREITPKRTGCGTK